MKKLREMKSTPEALRDGLRENALRHRNYNMYSGCTSLSNNSLNNISHLNCFFSELTAIYYIWKNYDIKEWIGFCHYRRFFEFLDNVPDLNEMDVDVVLPQHFEFEQSVYDQYANCANKEDLDLERISMLDEIINERESRNNENTQEKSLCYGGLSG